MTTVNKFSPAIQAPTVDTCREPAPAQPKLVAMEMRGGECGGALISLKNVPERGRLELINLSANPAARFLAHNTVKVDASEVSAEGVGRFDLDGAASGKLQAKAGDVLSLRTVNKDGVPSPSVNVVFEPAAGPRTQSLFGSVGRFLGAVDSVAAPGTTPTAVPVFVDARKPHVLANHVRISVWNQEQRDAAQYLSVNFSSLFRLSERHQTHYGVGLTRAQILEAVKSPEVSDQMKQAVAVLTSSRIVFANAEIMHGFKQDGIVTSDDFEAISNAAFGLHLQSAFEPGSSVVVKHERTGSMTGASFCSVEIDGCATFPLQDRLQNGDKLLIHVVDSNGVQGEPVEVTYSATSRRGVAPTFRSPLEARLAGHDTDG